jgi:enoyl-CoA hydratase/carnithine racemase
MTTLLTEVKDGIAILTLNRPDKLNALNYALVDALQTALDELEALNVPIDEGLAIEATQFASMVGTPDIRQGIEAFLSRRERGSADRARS